eukprot:62789-Hanusia_phi.AAC.1
MSSLTVKDSGPGPGAPGGGTKLNSVGTQPVNGPGEGQPGGTPAGPRDAPGAAGPSGGLEVAGRCKFNAVPVHR